MMDHVSRLVERQRIRHEMDRAIAIPVRRDRIASSRRTALENAELNGPTDFALQRRAELMGQGTYCALGSPETHITGDNTGILTGTALGILRTQDKIAWVQFRAGSFYAGLQHMLFGKVVPGTSSIFRNIALDLVEREQVSRRATETEEDHAIRTEEARIMYYRGDNRLRALPFARRVREILRRVCLNDALPDPKRPNQLHRLREGLQELVDTWDLDAKRRK